jgi:hypothetical protein
VRAGEGRTRNACGQRRWSTVAAMRWPSVESKQKDTYEALVVLGLDLLFDVSWPRPRSHLGLGPICTTFGRGEISKIYCTNLLAACHFHGNEAACSRQESCMERSRRKIHQPTRCCPTCLQAGTTGIVWEGPDISCLIQYISSETAWVNLVSVMAWYRGHGFAVGLKNSISRQTSESGKNRLQF